MGSSQNPLAVSAPVRLLFIGNKEDDFHRLRTLLSQPNGASFHLDHALSTRESLARLEQAAYDLVLFDGAIEYVPDVIVAQLADGGRLGAALLDRGVTRLIVGRKSGEAFGYLSLSDAGVPALPGFALPKTFTF